MHAVLKNLFVTQQRQWCFAAHTDTHTPIATRLFRFVDDVRQIIGQFLTALLRAVFRLPIDSLAAAAVIGSMRTDRERQFHLVHEIAEIVENIGQQNECDWIRFARQRSVAE
jgi:hypothetical protein